MLFMNVYTLSYELAAYSIIYFFFSIKWI